MTKREQNFLSNLGVFNKSQNSQAAVEDEEIDESQIVSHSTRTYESYLTTVVITVVVLKF